MTILKPSADDVTSHLETCVDGPDCKLRLAQAWAERVARPEHVSEVRDVMMSLHLSDIHARSMEDSANALTTFLGALVRRAPGRTMEVKQEELVEGDRLVLEETDEGLDISLVPEPVGRPS